ncbi:hypothetical protein FPZ54_00790 [Sphingomonas suaedae]|uniref:Uncharacterized protein n=1 Tax=Sphingomonas suaedae TaxID=2599297 RepID=A0A518RB72_9SPHN|nr:hypothetical protein [Sphingomonas suaedae]QDX24707.1 hypothetical protein FPZ54_00790 [Sphingomonas suaedae]
MQQLMRLDELGRYIIEDETILENVSISAGVTAGGTTNMTCHGTNGSCSNTLSCTTSTNQACSNLGACGGATNGQCRDGGGGPHEN